MPHKKYTQQEEQLAVNEPMVAYTSLRPSPLTLPLAENTVKRPVALLGLSFTKPYNEVENEYDFIDWIRVGLPKKALDNLMSITGFTNSEIAQIIHTSDRTLRRYTAKQKLDAEQSERVIELAKLYSRGEEIFGSMDKFKAWMGTEVTALGIKKPKTFLDTSLGIEMLMDELGRIEQGVFA